MGWLIVAVSAAVVGFIVTRAVHGRRLDSVAHPAPEMSVRLSVLPTRTAVVVLDVGVDAPPAAVARLVEHAVRDAFVFDAVDIVEVRRGNGELLEQRRRSGVLSA
jgi:Ethanolamine utilization protein EutJ (predicted chaperonin)